MAQLVEFPYLPPGDPHAAVNALIRLCRDLPADGERFPAFRARMKELRLWERNKMRGTFAFFDIERTGTVTPSPVMRRVGTSRGDGGARDVLAKRLWDVNPLVFKAVVDRLSERVVPRDELIKHFDTYAYRGEAPLRPQLEVWIKLALGLDVLKLVGVALDLDERGKGFVDAARQLDVDDFLEDEADAEAGPDGAAAPTAATDEPGEGDATRASGGEPGATVVEAAPRAAMPDPPAATPARVAVSNLAGGVAIAPVGLASPLGRGGPRDVMPFAGAAVFPDDVLAATTARIEVWWTEHAPQRCGASAADFGFEAEHWLEQPGELLYRVAVAAALVFRLEAGRDGAVAAFSALDAAGVLSALYEGTAPDALPHDLDARALMLASVVARRCAEAPDLAAALDGRDSAAEAFARLDEALGRGLFRLELFWIAGALAELGALRFPDVADFAAPPHRPVRDALFRLGFVASPYAADTDELVAAARSTRRAAGAAAPAEEVVLAFALAAGCAYDCPHRKQCDVACRERAER